MLKEFVKIAFSLDLKLAGSYNIEKLEGNKKYAKRRTEVYSEMGPRLIYLLCLVN